MRLPLYCLAARPHQSLFLIVTEEKNQYLETLVDQYYFGIPRNFLVFVLEGGAVIPCRVVIANRVVISHPVVV